MSLTDWPNVRYDDVGLTVLSISNRIVAPSSWQEGGDEGLDTRCQYLLASPSTFIGVIAALSSNAKHKR
ncbi:hypothetical protein BAUCODRAFT_39872 [Baudoinia panamericana UAMH 10762]|uniref:Uncharacterized protein n=1 Tax=Baudoinia panamericana (strain UAMH 10762) TaxID=717646 RepID=M2MX73_BAUPA|nr:uncharacterized protein BAUCODRAFT_39872 [Baudoinia panamericana UAMH 10762]EMC90850.1 hypothetical protein BAUCODRAFT_39872 [Baudoinia panamericana UAMH 10762]